MIKNGSYEFLKILKMIYIHFLIILDPLKFLIFEHFSKVKSST